MQGDRVLEIESDDLRRKNIEHRIYRHRVTGITIVICSSIFLGGLWATGINMEDLVWKEGMFNSKQHICLKSQWYSTSQGEKDRVELCSEWIDLSDLSGEIHTLAIENLEIIKGNDGKIRARLQRGINYRLVGVGGFLLLIILLGALAQHYFISKHLKHLRQTP
jgi:hypothetical protein